MGTQHPARGRRGITHESIDFEANRSPNDRIGCPAVVAFATLPSMPTGSATPAILDEFELPGYAINVGPKGCVMLTTRRVTSNPDFIGLDADLAAELRGGRASDER